MLTRPQHFLSHKLLVDFRGCENNCGTGGIWGVGLWKACVKRNLSMAGPGEL
jgi:hypothetical protein